MHDDVAILLAGGRGARMDGAVADKILARIGGRPVFVHSLRAFLAADVVRRFVVVYRDAAQRDQLESLVRAGRVRPTIVWTAGGRERQNSVARGLRAAARGGEPEHVFIHDCARPLVRPEALGKLADAVRRDGAACLAHRVTDTIKRAASRANSSRRLRLTTVDRNVLWAMETPQAFRWKLITDAYAVVAKRRLRITDDASALELAGRGRVTLVESPAPNPKITQAADLRIVAALLRGN